MSVTIIGAGLAGLATAHRLVQAGIDVQILEANAFAGGRIQPAIVDGHQDLGPTWVWPYAQPVIKHWLEELNLTLFDQFETGSALIDRYHDQPAQPYNLPTQYGSQRISGGTYALIAALLDKLRNNIRFEHVVNSCVVSNNQWHLNVSARYTNNTPDDIYTEQLVVATPPRLAAIMFNTEPASTSNELKQTIQLLESTPTWMAPHAKVVAVYQDAFWREQNLSGRVASHLGPLVEIHDHCGPDGSPAALFGFAGVSAQMRHDHHDHLITAIKQQLKRCFGEQAPEPTSIIIKDWAFEPFTSTAADRDSDGAHPEVMPELVRKALCERSLHFAASETSNRSPGLIEGALARADAVASEIIDS